MASRGEQALARLIARLSRAVKLVDHGADPAKFAAEIWPDFKEAVAAAQSEKRAAELEGVDRWQNARHGQKG